VVGRGVHLRPRGYVGALDQVHSYASASHAGQFLLAYARAGEAHDGDDQSRAHVVDVMGLVWLSISSCLGAGGS